MNDIIYKSPSIKVVEIAVNDLICLSPESYNASHEGFEEEEYTW